MLARWMPPGSGVEPLRLFRTLAVHEQLAGRMRPLGAGILGSHALVEPRLREVAIARTCALTGAGYEWGVHAVAFARPLGLSDEQLRSTVHGGPEDPCWDEREAAVMALADELHHTSTIGDQLWQRLGALFEQAAGTGADRDLRLLPRDRLRLQRSRRPARGVGRAVPASRGRDVLDPARWPAARIHRPDARHGHRRKIWIALLAVAVAGLVAFALSRLNLSRAGHALITATPGWIALSLLLMGASLVLRSVSWQQVLRAALPDSVIRWAPVDARDDDRRDGLGGVPGPDRRAHARGRDHAPLAGPEGAPARRGRGHRLLPDADQPARARDPRGRHVLRVRRCSTARPRA